MASVLEASLAELSAAAEPSVAGYERVFRRAVARTLELIASADPELLASEELPVAKLPAADSQLIYAYTFSSDASIK